MNVVCLKMSNGDELIAREESNGEYSHVMRIVVHQAQDGRVGMSMMPYITVAKSDTVYINKSHVVAITDVDSGIEKKYIEQTSGIALV